MGKRNNFLCVCLCERARNEERGKMERERCTVKQTIEWVVGQTHMIPRCPAQEVCIPDI